MIQPMPVDRAVLTVDLAVIARNWATVRDRYTGTTLGAVVKYDAYGLGAAQIAPLLHALGCRDFWVSHLDEALALKPLLPDSRLFVLNGFCGAPATLAQGIVPALASLEQIAALRAAHQAPTPRPVAIQLDTGLTRLGLNKAAVAHIVANPRLLDGLTVIAWVTHLARYDRPEARQNTHQRRRFLAWTARLPAAPLSLAASSSVFSAADWHFDHARCGSALYGVDTTPARPQPLEPVATLSAPILHVSHVAAGVEVGYRSLYRTPSPRRLATLAIGYGDGLPPGLAGAGSVVIDGHHAPIVGGLAMGLVSVDVTDLPDGLARPGVRAEIYGQRQRLETVAAAAGIAPNVLLTATASRALRHYLGP